MSSTLATMLAVVALVTGVLLAQTPEPPVQPADGPGGRAYPHGAVSVTRLGVGAEEAYVFEPAAPTPRTAPVVVFGHGWLATNPNIYGAWVTHLVRRGFTVVYPRYQLDARTPVRDFTANALTGVTSALDVLRRPGHVVPDERGLAFVGHSMGGLVAANLAAHAARGALPAPLALMVVEPGKTWPRGSPIAFELEDLSSLPSSLLLLAVVGDDDDFVGEIDARKVYAGATAVPRGNRDYVRLMSDDHGAPGLLADHRAPSAPSHLVEDLPVPDGRARDGVEPRLVRSDPVTNALDYYGTWKLFDGLADAVFHGEHREFALGGTAEQRYMGRWSDGRPVRELIVREP